jgi:ABC-type branched-subunit amino acid transport system substrate-binding protein
MKKGNDMVRTIAGVVIALCLLIPTGFACTTEEAQTTKIGCVLSTTGLLGPKGIDRLAAARLAVDELNAAGGLLGRQIELLEADDATNPDRCRELVEGMVEKDRIQVLIGGMSSGAVMATGSYLAEQEVLMVSPSATSPEISQQPWANWVFRTAPDDLLQAIILSDIIMNKKYTRLATIVQANAYGKGLEDALIEVLEKNKWTGQHILSIYFDPEKKDFRSDLQNIAESFPDVVLAVTYVKDGIILFKQASEFGLEGIAWLGCDGNYGEAMFADKKCADFMEKAIVAGTRSVAPSDKIYNEFADAYKAATGKEPSVYCDTTYDAVMLIADAIKEAGVYNGKEIRDELLLLGQRYRGVSGNVTFNNKGGRVSGIYEIWAVDKDNSTESGYKNIQIELISVM